MPEIKHTFQKGKMNKDLDERIVPNGEYRDAMNIQVRTSDGDAVGTAQNIQGNVQVSETYSDAGTRCVASITDEKNDNAYYFFAHPVFTLMNLKLLEDNTAKYYIDTILKQPAVGDPNIVFADLWTAAMTSNYVLGVNNVTGDDTDLGETNTSITDLDIAQYENVGDSTGGVISQLSVTLNCYANVRVGMRVSLYGSNASGDDDDGVELTDNLLSLDLKIKDQKTVVVDGVTSYILLFHETHPSSEFVGAKYFVFSHDKVLGFSWMGNYITGINIIDDLLFWTDNVTEPKVINIKKSDEGTFDSSWFTGGNPPGHTNIHAYNNALNFPTIVSLTDNNLGSDPINYKAQEKNITVIKRAPKTAPTLHMKSSLRSSAENVFIDHAWINNTDNLSLSNGEIQYIQNNSLSDSNFRKNDILICTQVDSSIGVDANNNPLEVGSPIIIKVKFISYINSDNEEVLEFTNKVKIQIISLSDASLLSTLNNEWRIDLEQRKPLFERKMVRFGYRYKYEDGEYSSFSPWSELAFLPSEFDYSTKEAYNLGMVNNVRELIIKDFIPYKRPVEVKEIDILYKATDSANVYVAATVTRGKSNEWELFTPDGVETIDGGDGEIKTGQLTITSEMVHKVLPSRQMLRGWDNVPRIALAQEITGNRLVYGNYVQGYDIKDDINLLQEVVSTQPGTFPQKSIKSIRDYKIGMVFGDKYGRETPVITSRYSLDSVEGDEGISGDISIEKTLCAHQNRFKIRLDWDNPSSWVQDGGYVKYYVKEISNEYYNLVMDRWYDSGDDTIWLSFNSADRNKVDEETYLLLKNRNGSNEPVLEKARYKIIAIENEAPDYIKTEYLNLGSVVITAEDTLNTIWDSDAAGYEITAPPYGFWDSDYTDSFLDRTIQITITAWNQGSVAYVSGISDADTNNGIFGREIKGTIEMQIVGSIGGNEVYSSWRRLTQHAKQGNTAIQLSWNKSFSNNANGGANMYQAFNCINPGICTNLVYTLKFREALVENKPEFDGKFFVKIAKDEILHQQVINGSFNYSPIQDFQLSYIESATKNQGNTSLPWGSNVEPEANFNTAGGDTPATDWFYQAFAGFVNIDGSTEDNETFGLARWNEENGGGQYEVGWGGADGINGSMYNGGWATYENVIGSSMATNPSDSWYIYNGPPLDTVSWDDPGYHYYFEYDTGSMINHGGSDSSPTPGNPFPTKWNFNYYGRSRMGSPLQGKVVNRQHPTWFGNNERQWNAGIGDEISGYERGPSIMGQLCGPGETYDNFNNIETETWYYEEDNDGEDSGNYGYTFYYNDDQFQLTDSETANFLDGMAAFEWYNSNGLHSSQYDYGSLNGVSTYNEMTKTFWESYAFLNGKMFIDGAGSRRAFGGKFGNGSRVYNTIPEEAWDGLPGKSEQFYYNADPNADLDGNLSGVDGVGIEPGFVDFYKHPGIDRGICNRTGEITGVGTVDGSIGRMFLSYLSITESNNIGLINALFQNGAMFSFINAPLDENGEAFVYRVVYVDKTYVNYNYSRFPSWPLGYGVDNYQNELNHYLGWKCYPCGSGGPYEIDGMLYNQGLASCARKTTAIEFRRIDRSDNNTTDLGIPIEGEYAYDPRNWVHHDGRDSLGIQIWDYDNPTDADGNSINNHLGACWETEPKESVDVDLYYEASNALPIVLNSNSFNYIQPNSKVTVTRETDSGVTDVPLYGSEHKVKNLDFFTEGEPIVSIINRSTPFGLDGLYLHKDNIIIGDTLTFEDPSGLKTSTKVINYVKPISDDGVDNANIGTPSAMNGELNAEEITSGAVDNTRAFQRVESSTVTVQWALNFAQESGADGVLTEAYWYNALIVPNTIPINVLENTVIQSIAQSVPETGAPNGVINNTWNVNNSITITGIIPSSLFTELYGISTTGFEEYNFITLGSIDGSPISNLFTSISSGENNGGWNNGLMTGEANIETVFQPDIGEWSVLLPFTITYMSRTGYYEVDKNVWKYPVELSWFNCYTFGNGVESDRVRDDFNAPQIDNGVKVSTTFSGYGEEKKSSGMIYSGLYNSTSEVNDLNEFNMSEKITKDLNPSYGSIQRLKTRDTDIITFTEDKVLKVLSNKDAVFNADGNPQLTATNRVLGQAVPFVGDFGISKNPESLAWDQFRMYFTDKQRGAVLRLSRDGLTPISNIGMKTWFRDYLRDARDLLGTFDIVNGEYNITINPFFASSGSQRFTVSFNEAAKGWVSFKSFIPSHGTSVSGKYFTAKYGSVYEHYIDTPTIDRNNFYGDTTNSHVDILFNDQPSVVKSFKTINYEGSQAKITERLDDNQYYNLTEKDGWWANNIETDLQEGDDIEFKDKENKWFNYLKGTTTELSNIDTKEFSVQGIGSYIDITLPGENPEIPADGCGDGFVLNDDGECVEIEYVAIVYGCTDPMGTNYNADANTDDGSCCYVSGCTDPSSFNFNPDACNDDGSCEPIVWGCIYGGATEYNLDVLGFGLTSGLFPDIYGNNRWGNPCTYPCQTSLADGGFINQGWVYYGVDPNANSFSFDYCSQPVGCGNPLAINYVNQVTESMQYCNMSQWPAIDGLCMGLIIDGENQFTTTNISNALSVFEDGANYAYVEFEPGASPEPQSITYWGSDAAGTITPEPQVFTYNPIYFLDESLCNFVYDCIDPTACNYNSMNGVLENNELCTYAEAGYDCFGNCLNDSDGDGVCDEFEIPGCTDSTMFNYDPLATDDDNSCVPFIYGCMDVTAVNFNLNANTDNGECNYDIFGCTDPLAVNYNVLATVDDESCTYAPPVSANFGVINNPSDSDALVIFDPLSGDIDEQTPGGLSDVLPNMTPDGYSDDSQGL